MQHLTRYGDKAIDLLIAEVKIGSDTVEKISFAVIADLIEADFDKVKRFLSTDFMQR